jgi:hypothetical protein
LARAHTAALAAQERRDVHDGVRLLATRQAVPTRGQLVHKAVVADGAAGLQGVEDGRAHPVEVALPAAARDDRHPVPRCRRRPPASTTDTDGVGDHERLRVEDAGARPRP